MIVSGGEALVDLVPHPVPGGGPFNVAIAVARRGRPAAFLGRVSTDESGDLLWDHLARNGVDLRAAERGPEPTARAIVDPGPPLRFQFEGDGTADTCLSSARLSALDPGPHVLHGGTLGLFRGSTAKVLAELVEQHDGLVSLDPNVRPAIIGDRAQWEHYHQRWVDRCHVYRGSDEDLAWIWPGREHASIAEELLGGTVELVAVTRGAQGVDFYGPAGQVTVPARPVDVVDTVGAGDTFVASMLCDLHDRVSAEPGFTPRDLTADETVAMGERAVAAAAIVCARPGADPPSEPELMQYLQAS